MHRAKLQSKPVADYFAMSVIRAGKVLHDIVPILRMNSEGWGRIVGYTVYYY